MLLEMHESDVELLKRYHRDHSEKSFAEIVRRHLPLVYSAALRQVRSPQLALEVAQTTFIDLAQSAGRLGPDTVLTAWLYKVARRTAIDIVRKESRRRLREQVASEMNAMNATDADWTRIEPLLDDAMAALDGTERTAVLLRYFEGQSLREVGQALGTSEDAAQKRVSRAVDRLRECLARNGVAVGASGLVVAISGNAVQAVPAGLAVTISTAATLAGAGFATTVTATTTQALAMTALQKTLVTTTIAIAAGFGIFEAQQAASARDDIRSLKKEYAGRIGELTAERDKAAQELASLRKANERLSQNGEELLELRGRVGVLSQELEALKSRPPIQPPAKQTAAVATPHVPGAYITKDELAFAGYGTPEKAIESFAWVLLNGTYEQLMESMPPGVRQEAERRYSSRGENLEEFVLEKLEALRAEEASQFQGMQVVERKVLADDKVELKIRLNIDPAMSQLQPAGNSTPGVRVVSASMVRVGNEWKFVD